MASCGNIEPDSRIGTSQAIKLLGTLMLCKSQSALDHEAQLIELGKELGIQAELCDPARLKSLDPDIQMNVAGAVWYALAYVRR